MTLGSSGALRLAFDRPRLGAGRALFCYALTETLWVTGGAISNGGNVVGWAGRALAPDLVAASTDPDAALLELAASVPAGADGLAMVPYLIAERAPHWDPDLPGAYLGLRDHHTRAHLIRAAVEGVCTQMRFILDRLDAMVFVESVRATGGAFRSQLWRDVMAATLDRPFYVVDEAEGTALGAAALGLIALGTAASPAEALAQLAGNGAPAPAPVAAYAGLRNSLAPLIDDLGAVAGLPRHSTAR